MFLALRMAGYFGLPILAGYGLGEFDPSTGNFTITFNVDTAAEYLVQVGGGYAAIFLASRKAKTAGGLT